MSCCPIRYFIILTALFIGVVSILNRLNVNIAIVSMVKDANVTKEHPDICPSLTLTLSDEDMGLGGTSTPSSVGEDLPEGEDSSSSDRFAWSPEVQGIVLGCFFWTYFICQTPSGFVAGRYGGYVPICISLLASGIISTTIPFVIHVSVYLFIALRVLLGIFQSAIFPGLFVILCSWVPLNERATAIAINDIGPNLGNLLIMFSSGFIINGLGWQATFYIPGALSLVCFLIVVPFLRNMPEDHSLVSEEELNHIRGRDVDKETRTRSESNKSVLNEFEESLTNKITREPIPWLKILTNKAVLTMLLFKFSRSFLGYLISSEMPTYMKTVLHVDVVSIGILTGVHLGFHIIAVLVSARFTEMFIIRGYVSRTNGRKAMSLLSGFTSALFLVMIPIMRCNLQAVRVIYIITGFFAGCGTATDSALSAEMSTKFHAILFSLGNLCANIPGFLAPMITGAVLESVPDRWKAWDIVFFSVGGWLVFANIVFLIFASAKRQDFDLTLSERRASRRLSSLVKG